MGCISPPFPAPGLRPSQDSAGCATTVTSCRSVLVCRLASTHSASGCAIRNDEFASRSPASRPPTGCFRGRRSTWSTTANGLLHQRAFRLCARFRPYHFSSRSHHHPTGRHYDRESAQTSRFHPTVEPVTLGNVPVVVAFASRTPQRRSKRSRFMTLSQVATKSCTNLFLESSQAYTSARVRSTELEPNTRSTAVAVH